MSPGQEAYDAEIAAIAYGLFPLVQRGREGQSLALFADSQAAMRRIMDDASGPGQEIAVEVVGLARRLEAQGNTIKVRWAPAH